MKRSRFSRAADYVPPVVAFVAAVGAVIGAPKWNAQAIGFAKATSLGWLLLAIGLVALVTSILVIRRNHHEQEIQKALKARIAATGKDQILRGLDRIVCVFRESSHWHKTGEAPISPLELLDPERRTALSALNLNSLSPYFDGKKFSKWWEMFETAAVAGAEQITTALQIYVTFLDPEIIEASTRLLNCEFQHRLRHIHSVIDANTRENSDKPVLFFWVEPHEHHDSGYTEFWTLVEQLAARCKAESSSRSAGWVKPREYAVS